MKKSVFTTVAVAALVFGMGTSSAFAKTPSHANPFNHPMSPVSERNFMPKNPKANGMQKGMNHRPNHNVMQKADLIGTVSAVNTDTKTITVKDADGKETQVHINPFTHLNAIPTPEERKAAAESKKTGEKKSPSKNALTISDVKSGDFVAVKKMDTETKTLEAARIIVTKEK